MCQKMEVVLQCSVQLYGLVDKTKTNSLRVAALRFGQDGDDFWPGPLTVDKKRSRKQISL